MRKLKILLSTLAVLALALLPALGALFELGSSLGRIERMHARAPGPTEPRELVGSYEVDPATMDGALHLRWAVVKRQ